MPATKRQRRLNVDGPYRHTLKELGQLGFTMATAPGGYVCPGCGRHIKTGFTHPDVPGVRCRDCFCDYREELSQAG